MLSFEVIKEVMKTLQKAGNIDLINQLIDFQSRAMELQEEKYKLQKENNNLKHETDITNKIERYNYLFLTLDGDEHKIPYCSRCWDVDKKLVQVSVLDSREYLSCPQCNNMIPYCRKILSQFDFR